MFSSTISKGKYCWPNVDLLSLSSLSGSEFNPILLDANTNQWDFGKTIKEIKMLTPFAICTSFGASTKKNDHFFIKVLKKEFPACSIASIGGVLYYNFLEEMKNNSSLDIVLLSYVTDDYYKFLQNKNSSELKNVVYRKGGDIVSTVTNIPDANFKLGIPKHNQLPLSEYQLSHGKHVPLTAVATSFGCPSTCTFCVSGRIRYVMRDPNNILEELKYIKNIGIKEVFFRDNVFGYDLSQTEILLKGMIRENLCLSWVADTRADILTENNISLMKQAGCHSLHIGVESYKEQTLKKYAKKLTISQIERSFKLCHQYGITSVGYFILGLPGETKQDVLNTIDFAIKLDCDYASFNTPLPIIGTSLNKVAESESWIDSANLKEYDGSKRSNINTDLLSPNEIDILQKEAYKKFYLRPKYAYKAIKRIRTVFQIKMLFLEFINFIKGSK